MISVRLVYGAVSSQSSYDGASELIDFYLPNSNISHQQSFFKKKLKRNFHLKVNQKL